MAERMINERKSCLTNDMKLRYKSALEAYRKRFTKGFIDAQRLNDQDTQRDINTEMTQQKEKKRLFGESQKLFSILIK